MAKKIQPTVDTFHGINNAFNPCSAQYRQGMAYDAQNSRINESGIWDKAAGLGAIATSPSVRGVPVDDNDDHPHVVDCNILGTHIIARYLKNDSHVVVGPNKYAYVVDDDLGAGRKVYYWDGTDVTTAVTFADNATASNYDFAGMGRPTAALAAVDNPASAHGGRMEQGTYYYMYTYYDTVREAESLPSSVYDWVAAAWGGDPLSAEYPDLVAKADASHDPSTGSGRYDTNTKVRFYRSKRSYEPDNAISAPNVLFYVGETDYTPNMVINGASAADPCVITCTTTHGISNGDIVYIHDITGNMGDDVLNDTFVIAANVHVANKTFECTTDGTTGVSTSGKTYTSGGKAEKMTLSDYAHDTEIEQDMYEGRGTPPPTNVDCMASFNNRMYYFIGNVVYWSSAGRPEEVALDYTLTYVLTDPDGGTTQTTTVPTKPVLTQGLSAEAKYEIAELAGQTIIGAYPLRGKLFIWTSDTTGYLNTTLTSEGVKYIMTRKGIGLVSNKTLAHTPYGLFGADREGVWQIDSNGILKRLSKYILDINTSTKSSYALQSTLTESFGIWVAALEEYWWCVKNTGETTVYRQMAYQPARNIFGGLYAYQGLSGGCAFTSAGGAQVFIAKQSEIATIDDDGSTCTVVTVSAHGLATGDEIDVVDTTNYDTTNKTIVVTNATTFTYTGSSDDAEETTGIIQLYVAETPSESADEVLAQTLQFWMGQHSLDTVKDNVKVEIIYESVTSSKEVSVIIYQNSIASTTGATTSSTFAHSAADLVGRVEPHGSGRMFLVNISIPADCVAPIIHIGYEANLILWAEKAKR